MTIIRNYPLKDLKVRDKRIREDLGDLTELGKSLDENGFIHPLLVDEDDYIHTGTRRYFAATERGIEYGPIDRREGLSEDEWAILEYHENAMRKELDPVEDAVGLAKAQAAHERLYPETKQGGTLDKTPQDESGKFVPKNDNLSFYGKKPKLEVEKQESKEEEVPELHESFAKAEAKKAGVSERTIQRKVELGKAILEKKIDKETVEQVRNKEISRNKALKKIREERERKKKLGLEIAKKAMEEKKKKLAEELTEITKEKQSVQEFDKKVDEHNIIGKMEDLLVAKSKVEEFVPESPEEAKYCEDCTLGEVYHCPECKAGFIICRRYQNLQIRDLEAEACEGYDDEY